MTGITELTKALVMLDFRDFIVLRRRHLKSRDQHLAPKLIIRSRHFAPPSLPRVLVRCSPLLQQPFRHDEWIKPARRQKPTKFDEINPTFAGFHFGHPAMGNLEDCRQIPLR